MSTVCNFPTCDRKPESTGWCIFHAIYSNSVAVKKAKPVKKESDKMKDIKKGLKKIYPVFLAKHPHCEIKATGCTKQATVVHHKAGRGKDNILNVKSYVACCPSCNLWCETNHKEAAERGLKLTKFKKVT